MLTGGLIAIATFGKFAGAFLGGEIGGLTARESLALGCGMNARGSTEIIIASIGLSMGVLNQSLFTPIVAMALITTVSMPPMLRWALARLPMTPVEVRERLLDIGVDLSVYASDLSAIHTVLKRLNEAGEIRLVPRPHGKSAYLWQAPPTAVAIGPEVARHIRQSGQFHIDVPSPGIPRKRKKER